MKLEGRLEIYRVAFDAAQSEMTEISAEFEKLRSRKDNLEKLVNVLKPLLPEGGQSVDQDPTQGTEHPQAESGGEVPVEVGGGPSAVVSDPFQRRIDHVLGIGAGIRDVRKYSRQF